MTSRLGAPRPLRYRGRMLAVTASGMVGAQVTTWNPSDIGPDIFLSNVNLTATKDITDSYASGRATVNRSAGKRYFEVTANNFVSQVDAALISFSNAAQSLITYMGGPGSNSIGYFGDGNVYANDAAVVTLAAYNDLAVVGCAVDLDLGRLWFRDGAGTFGTGNPETGANPHWTFAPASIWFPAFSVSNGDLASDQLTGNFGASAFTHALPAGYKSWNAA